MGYHVTIDDILLYVPSRDRCWDIKVVYACGDPVTRQVAGHTVDKVIRVKKSNHRGPCRLRRCIRASTTHELPEQCHRCQLVEARFEGASV
ncbi:hypothetical protein F5Y03DRAFT_341228 [Xylaria venustula]|nr:hypothetical protein F5Y03DRAFT_341228 [Xylaria venustula]